MLRLCLKATNEIRGVISSAVWRDSEGLSGKDDILDADVVCDYRTDPDVVSPHPAGCILGGFSCQYWLVDESCKLRHPNLHIHGRDEFCPLTL